jgi:hypothetical protein
MAGGVSALDLDIAGSLATELAPRDFGRIVDSFAEDIDRLADEMEAGDRAGDRMAIHRAAHGLAGAAAAIGAITLEQAARAGLGKGGYPPDLIAVVRQAGADAMRELRALVRTDTAA